MHCTADEMVSWHHWLNGHKFEQALGVGDGHGSLECYSPWGGKELDMTERLNWTRFVIVFLPRSKCLDFVAAVTICSDFGAQKNKECHCFHCFPIYLTWGDGTACHDLSFLNVNQQCKSTINIHISHPSCILPSSSGPYLRNSRQWPREFLIHFCNCSVGV